MDAQKAIDYIVSQEKKEIVIYILFAFAIVIFFSVLLFYNVISGNIEYKAAALTNFLPLAVEIFPLQQIVKRRKIIFYIDKIVREGVLEGNPESNKYLNILFSLIENVVKS